MNKKIFGTVSCGVLASFVSSNLTFAQSAITSPMGGLKDELGKISANVKKEKTLNERKESNSNSKYYYAACSVVLLLIAYCCGKVYLRYLIKGKLESLVPMLYSMFKEVDMNNLTLSEEMSKIIREEKEKEIDINKMYKLNLLIFMERGFHYVENPEAINENTLDTLGLISSANRIRYDSLEKNSSLLELFFYNSDLNEMMKNLKLQ